MRTSYLRGRALLAGLRWDRLSLAECIDFAEAALLEPALHGSMTTVDELLDRIADVVTETNPDPESFGTNPSAVRATEAAESAFPQAAPREP